MHCVPLLPEHVPGLYEIYLRATESVAHCRFVPSLAHFGQTLTQPAREGTRLLVAEENGIALGFAALLANIPAENGVRETQLTALFVEAELVADLLLNECLGQAQGVQRIAAFPAEHGRCPIPSYNGGWDGLSDQLRLQARVLSRAGFGPVYRELHLECSGIQFPPPLSSCPRDIEIVEHINAAGNFVVEARASGQQAGVCISNLLSRVSDHPDAAAWGYIGGLHVGETFRRRGISRHLLTYTLAQMHQRGCRGCWLTTGSQNWPAQPLYFSSGFEIVDASSCWRKEPFSF